MWMLESESSFPGGKCTDSIGAAIFQFKHCFVLRLSLAVQLHPLPRNQGCLVVRLQTHLCPFQMHNLYVRPGDESEFTVGALETKQQNQTKPPFPSPRLVSCLFFVRKPIILLNLI